MRKRVVFVGGLHGAGKTSLITELSRKHGYISKKQRHLVIETGQDHGFGTWEEIGPRHDQFIYSAANLAVQNFLDSKTSVLLIDCHYAIRSAKALRIQGRVAVPSYIHDLDPMFVLGMSQDFDIKFVLVLTEPEQIIGRFHERPPHLLDYDNTIAGLREQEMVEKEFLLRLKKIFRIPSENILFLINNNSRFHASAQVLQEFIALP